jgi:hypothetical protein
MPVSISFRPAEMFPDRFHLEIMLIFTLIFFLIVLLLPNLNYLNLMRKPDLYQLAELYLQSGLIFLFLTSLYAVFRKYFGSSYHLWHLSCILVVAVFLGLMIEINSMFPSTYQPDYYYIEKIVLFFESFWVDSFGRHLMFGAISNSTFLIAAFLLFVGHEFTLLLSLQIHHAYTEVMKRRSGSET